MREACELLGDAWHVVLAQLTWLRAPALFSACPQSPDLPHTDSASPVVPFLVQPHPCRKTHGAQASTGSWGGGIREVVSSSSHFIHRTNAGCCAEHGAGGCPKLRAWVPSSEGLQPGSGEGTAWHSLFSKAVSVSDKKEPCVVGLC